MFKSRCCAAVLFLSTADAALFCFVLHCVISVISENSPGIRAQKKRLPPSHNTCGLSNAGISPGNYKEDDVRACRFYRSLLVTP